ncbi:DUF4301 family protein [Poritiphilus flavus]|uniref:DUF4301 family protein n=1 Tax=Poritiphilus flavus TaxID=2697053 RepID=A0A6L9ED26_9FLAO|nr:DUF4301 family protein [Poritiphilus flavus]NAS12645.1 DUF4301 family protein [Poritiphilus flavus]
MTTFSAQDLQLLANKDISQKQVLDQIETFEEGIPFVELAKPAIVSDGILKFTEAEETALISDFDAHKKNTSLLKFVPASGAASRMFKALFAFLDSYDPKEDLDSFIERTGNAQLRNFFNGLSRFPFYKKIEERLEDKKLSENEKAVHFVREMLLEEGLNFGFYPKGLLPFHDYGKYTATPFEEHLKEASDYAAVDGEAHLHFTISEQHISLFSKEFEAIKERVLEETGTEYHVSYSYQKASTDTIAVTLENEPFRNSDGTILFRPGGHGALIENLNEQHADIIFIKNIDNVVVPKYAVEVGNGKKVLAGLLLRLQKETFRMAELLETGTLEVGQLEEIKAFLEDQLNVRFSEKFSSFSIAEQIEVLKDKINRPIRICGMVKNEGEPGGGPFWITDRHGHVSLQIVESAQVDMSDETQEGIFKGSTHFNPVDLVCGVRNHKGEKFNLLNFVDKKQGFITSKTQEGKELKALELPGLWNGGMAFWNTVFVEVPLVTFNPVKTVNDLLKPAHQV